MKVDLKDFTTVDSIGEIDDDLDGSDTELNVSELDDESLGLKYVKKVEALHCEICENYLSHDLTNEEEIILKHCKTKIHLKLSRNVKKEKDVEEMDQEPTNLEPSEECEIKEETADVNESMEVVNNEDSVNDDAVEEKSTVENNDEEDDEDDETVLNIDILR